MSSSNEKPEGWSHPTPPFHPGERALQARHGLVERLDQVGRHVMREAMPEQHREFFAELPFLVVGSADSQLRPWASILAGPPGFVSSPDPKTLAVGAHPADWDPLCAQLQPGAELGLLGIQLDTRRRNRMNGSVAETGDFTREQSSEGDAGFRVRVAQSFGNCPKYIQRRRAVYAPVEAGGSAREQNQNAAGEAAPEVVAEGPWLTSRARALIGAADTFFIASLAPQTPEASDPARGVDVSHRGGPQGFVDVRSTPQGDVLSFREFQGNYFFNTLGNLLLHPFAGLSFLDFDDGSLLLLSGTTELFLHEEAGPRVELRVTEGRYVPAALPLRFERV